MGTGLPSWALLSKPQSSVVCRNPWLNFRIGMAIPSSRYLSYKLSTHVVPNLSAGTRTCWSGQARSRSFQANSGKVLRKRTTG